MIIHLCAWCKKMWRDSVHKPWIEVTLQTLGIIKIGLNECRVSHGICDDCYDSECENAVDEANDKAGWKRNPISGELIQRSGR